MDEISSIQQNVQECTDGIYRRTDFQKWSNALFTSNTRRMIENHLRNMVNDVRIVGECDDATALVIMKKR